MKLAALALAAGVVVGFASGGLTDDLKATEQFRDASVAFEVGGSYQNLTLTIIGPNDFDAQAFSKSGAPSIDLRRFGAVDDGVYTYQLTATSDEKIKVRSTLDNGRGTGVVAGAPRSVITSGTFIVKGGVIVARGADTGKSDRDQP